MANNDSAGAGMAVLAPTKWIITSSFIGSGGRHQAISLLFLTSVNYPAMRPVITITSCSGAAQRSQGLSQWTSIWWCGCDWWPRGVIFLFPAERKWYKQELRKCRPMHTVCQIFSPAHRLVVPGLPEPIRHISHGLIPRCFSRPFIPLATDVLASSPPLILPRAEHSSPCSNTASGVPALVKTLPSFLIFAPSPRATLPPLECRGAFFRGENKALSVAAVVISTQGRQKLLWGRNWLQLSAEVEVIVLQVCLCEVCFAVRCFEVVKSFRSVLKHLRTQKTFQMLYSIFEDVQSTGIDILRNMLIHLVARIGPGDMWSYIQQLVSLA